MTKTRILTASELRSKLDYDPETGVFRWRKGSRKVVEGAIAGSARKNGYVTIRVNYIGYLAHRLAFLYMTGRWPAGEIDHADLNKSNNAWANLRECTRAQNNWNKASLRRSATGVKGVFPFRNKYRVVVPDGFVQRFFGYFDDLELAELVAQEARSKFQGEFARHQ